MLRGAALDKLLDEGYGDAGFNDPVPDIEVDDAPAVPLKAAQALAAARASAAAKANACVDAPAPAKQQAPAQPAAPKPHSRPVLGATPPPPEGTDPGQAEMAYVLDTAARERGFEDAEAYARYLEEQRGKGDAEAAILTEEPPLAPGIKKAPVYMPPGAYPGDRTKLGKAYDKESPPDPPQKAALGTATDGGVTTTFVRQADVVGARPADGNSVVCRFDGGELQRAVIGNGDLPWGLEQTLQRMKVGDIMDIVATGEYALCDSEPLIPDAERRWRAELVAVEGRARDKFQLDVGERIDLANTLRLRGNDMFKEGKLLRALDYYERGSKLMDVLEAEDLGMSGMSGMGMPPPCKTAVANNRRIWECQKPLLLNWALILMKRECWREAERKCTEVLMDIEKENVKALFRRGQCNIHLGNHEQARMDLRRAAELDTSIVNEVEREMRRVEEMQRQVDREDAVFAKRVVGELLQDEAPRCDPCGKSAWNAADAPGSRFLDVLQSHNDAVDRDGIDDDTYRRQREEIYNHFLKGGGVSFGGKPPDEDD